MIQTYSTTIRRKEMDAVLTCMVDEKIGPGELNARLIQSVKEFFGCDGAAAFRSPSIALKYALDALDLEKGSYVIISALAPVWQYQALVSFGYNPLVVDVDEITGQMSVQAVKDAVAAGGQLILLYEAEGILPDFDAITEAGVPVIEDISVSAGSSVALKDENGVQTENRKKAGSYGVFTICGLEEKDVITAGGGAVLFASGRREWIVLKKFIDEAPVTDLLPDINSALAWVQIKEFGRNEKNRKEIFDTFYRACLAGRHKMFSREMEEGSTMGCFPLILTSSFKDVKQYAAKKDIEIELAFEGSIISKYEELSEKCIRAKALSLRCIHIPMYPRLTQSERAKIIKVLSSLP